MRKERKIIIICLFLFLLIIVLFTKFINTQTNLYISKTKAEENVKVCSSEGQKPGDYKGEYCDTWSKDYQFTVSVSFGNDCEDIYHESDHPCNLEVINDQAAGKMNYVLPASKRLRLPSDDIVCDEENKHPGNLKGNYCETWKQDEKGQCHRVSVYYKNDCTEKNLVENETCSCTSSVTPIPKDSITPETLSPTPASSSCYIGKSCSECNNNPGKCMPDCNGGWCNGGICSSCTAN